MEIIQALLETTPNLDPKSVDDVIVGCANPEGEQGLQIGRQISVRALGKDVPGMTVNRYCASGLETIGMAVAKIRAGMADCIIAGGTESMSMIPMTGYKLAPSYKVAVDTPDYVVGMGLTAEAVAKNIISIVKARMNSLCNHTKRLHMPLNKAILKIKSCL